MMCSYKSFIVCVLFSLQDFCNADKPALENLKLDGATKSKRLTAKLPETSKLVPDDGAGDIRNIVPNKPHSHHPNASGMINPRNDSSYPDTLDWINPRDYDEKETQLQLEDFLIEEEASAFEDQKTARVGCGTHVINAGSTLHIHTRNYPQQYPKWYRGCSWIFKGVTSEMELNINCPYFQLPLCKRGSRKIRQRCLRTNFLVMKDQSGKISQRYRGWRGPKDVLIEGNSLTLVLRTRARALGFSCSIRAFSTIKTSTTMKPTVCDASCGVGPSSIDRIVGGTASSLGRWPWVAGLVAKGNLNVFCGASLINQNWAITAAHCAQLVLSENADVDLLLGAFDLDRPTSIQQRLQVTSLHVHPEYENATLRNDIALLHMASGASMSDKVSSICLPKDTDGTEGISASIAGWGLLQEDGSPSTVLQEAIVDLVPQTKCQEVYKDFLSTSMICAGGENKDACKGDSGGGLMWQKPSGKWALIGVVSWGHGCARPGLPGVYTDVKKFIPWIEKLAGLSACEFNQSSSSATTTTTTTTTTTIPPPLKACRCGRVYNRIVGGRETGVNEYPWQAALIRIGARTPFCGASIVGRRHVLTAAHCTQAIKDYKWRVEVMVGAHHVSHSSNTPFLARIPMDSMIQHQSYDISTLRNDISLIRLATPLDLDLDPRLAPVCLPTPQKTFTGADAVVSGWGKIKEGGSQPQALQKVWVPVITNDECEARYPGAIYPESLCAGFDEGGKDSCQGDSGGPLVTEENSSMVQIGVVSWGTGCARPRKPGVYARVTEYLDWIREVTGTDDPCA